MPRTPKDVTETELAVLQVLWDQGPSSRRQITDVLYPGGGPSHYGTVQKLLERLIEKECVVREKDDLGLTFRPVIDRESLISRRLLDMADQLCDGSVTPLFMNLVRARPLEDDELRQLQDALDALRDQSRDSKRRP